jgi:outer membrane lipoprotein carrier protein
MTRDPLIIAAVLAISALARLAPGRADGPKPAPPDPSLAAQLDDIDRRAGQARDLSGRFTQEKHTALLKKPLVSSGRIRMKGAVVRWDTESPEPTVLYSDGREIRMYYPRQATVEVYPIDRRLGDLAASPLPRLDILRRHFRIERAPDAPRDGKTVELKLTPTDESLAQHVDEVRVTLDVPSACVTRVEMLDADGDRTVIRFTDVRTNTGVKDGELELTVPAGTKVSRPLEGKQGGAKR